MNDVDDIYIEVSNDVNNDFPIKSSSNSKELNMQERVATNSDPIVINFKKK